MPLVTLLRKRSGHEQHGLADCVAFARIQLEFPISIRKFGLIRFSRELQEALFDRFCHTLDKQHKPHLGLRQKQSGCSNVSVTICFEHNSLQLSNDPEKRLRRSFSMVMEKRAEASEGCSIRRSCFCSLNVFGGSLESWSERSQRQRCKWFVWN